MHYCAACLIGSLFHALLVRLGRGLAETRRQRDSASLAESLWGMGGTLVTDECHLFDW